MIYLINTCKCYLYIIMAGDTISNSPSQNPLRSSTQSNKINKSTYLILLHQGTLFLILICQIKLLSDLQLKVIYLINTCKCYFCIIMPADIISNSQNPVRSSTQSNNINSSTYFISLPQGNAISNLPRKTPVTSSSQSNKINTSIILTLCYYTRECHF